MRNNSPQFPAVIMSSLHATVCAGRDFLAARRRLGAVGGRDGAGRLDRVADPAAAGGDGIRVLDPERLPHQVVYEVELRALENFERHGIDQHGARARVTARSSPARALWGLSAE